MPGKTVVLKILRQDGPDQPSRWEEFEVEREPYMNVISCLQAIQRNPVTKDGKKTTPVVWESSCLEEICGACTMVINQKVRQACSALVDQLKEPIELKPMTKFKLIRDLMVDRSPMFEALKKVKAWVEIDGSYDLGFGPKYSQTEQEERYELSKCMTCGCCLESCPNYNSNSSFIGAQPLNQVRLFNTHPTGKMQEKQRTKSVMTQGGVSYCGKSQNCEAVCPKEIPLTESISYVAWESVKEMFWGWLKK